VVKIPAHLSLEEGATLPCAGVTAWHALVEHGKLVAGHDGGNIFPHWKECSLDRLAELRFYLARVS
jgi:hypothetical protein